MVQFPVFVILYINALIDYST